MDTLNQNMQTEQAEPVEEQINLKRFVFEIVETLLLALILFVGINAVSARVRVDGYSMRPTLEDGEFILVNKLSYRWSAVERGDIIVFHHPGLGEDLIKRVIGLPGDIVLVQNSQVFVNGQLLNEPYISQAPLYSGEWVVNEGDLFVLGDNRNNSNDSKDWGLLPMENIVGKAAVIYWPWYLWDVIEHTDVFAVQ